jgi:4-cresol dehydrogenase (hydroxylating) flavoprotein subunit
VRPLLLDRTIANRAIMMNLMSMATAITKKSDWHPGPGTIPDEVRAAMQEATGIGAWNLRIGLYGPPEVMEVQQRRIQEAVAHIPGTRLVSREYPGDAKAADVFPPDHGMAGIPNMDLLKMLEWNGDARPGHAAFAPISPLTTEDARALNDLLDRNMRDIGKDYGAAFAMTSRSMQLFALILHNAADAADVDRVFERTAIMIKEAAALGYGEYRGHIELMDLIADQFDFNDHAQRRLTERIKDAIDPNGIIAPGRHGIWPTAYRSGSTPLPTASERREQFAREGAARA